MKIGDYDVVQTTVLDFEVRRRRYSAIDVRYGRSSRDLVVTRTMNFTACVDFIYNAQDAERTLLEERRAAREGVTV